MMRKSTIYIFPLLCFVFALKAQTGAGDYQSGFKKQGNTVYFSNTNADVTVEFCTSSMFRVRTSWNRSFEKNEPWMVVAYKWAPVNVQTADKNDHFLLQTEKLDIKVFKKPFRIDVFTKEGKLLSSETAVNGGAVKEGEAVACTKELQPDEHFFGFGERMDFMDQRGKKVFLDVGRGKGLPHEIGAYN